MVGSWNLLERFAQVFLDNFLAGHVVFFFCFLFFQNNKETLSPKIKLKRIKSRA